MKPVVDVILVERIINSIPYETLVGYYEYSDEELDAASDYIDRTAPDDLWSLMEELRCIREEEETWQW